MIYGTGVDMVEIARVAGFVKRHRLLGRVYGGEELACLSRPQGFAACFCAKEAFSKALGTGVRGFALSEVQLLHGPRGRRFL